MGRLSLMAGRSWERGLDLICSKVKAEWKQHVRVQPKTSCPSFCFSEAMTGNAIESSPERSTHREWAGDGLSPQGAVPSLQRPDLFLKGQSNARSVKPRLASPFAEK